MAAPVLQFKRGNLAALPGLQAGEPGWVTDSYDLFVGIDSTTNNNKVVGSARYWTREGATSGSAVRLVEGTNNGSHYVSLGSPANLTDNQAYILPATATAGGYMKVDGSGNMSWSTEVDITTPLSVLDIDGGTDIGADLTDADLLIVDDGGGGTNRKTAMSRVKSYVLGGASGATFASINVTGIGSIAFIKSSTGDFSGVVTASSFDGSLATSNLTGTVANNQLANSTVSFGGVSLALGASDATPAFNLTDATNYPASSLTGSVANSQLANSTVSFGGVSLALGASDATPAFDLTDATNYPTSSLTGTITNAQLAGSIADGKLAEDYVKTSEVDDSSIEFSGGTLNVKASGVTNAMLAGSIADGKLDADYVQTSEVDDSSIEFSGGTLNVKASGVTNAMLAGSIADGKLNEITTADKVNVSAINIDGATDIGADLADADLIVVDDGAGGTNRKAAMTRVKDYVLGGGAGANFVNLQATGITTTVQLQTTDINVSAGATVTGALDVDGGADIAGGLVANSAKVSDLTSGRVVLAGTDGEIEDSGNLTFDGSDLGVTGGVTASGTVQAANVTATSAATLASAAVQDLTDGRVVLAGAGGELGDDAGLTYGDNDLRVTGGINASGIASATQFATGAAGSAIVVTSDTITGPSSITLDPAALNDNSGTVFILGDLQVKGTTTQVDSTTVSVADLAIEVARGAANDAAANGAGFTVDSGDGDKTFHFEALGDNFGSSENLNLASGKVLKVNNTEILSASALASTVAVDVASINLDGATAIGADLADADLFLVDDGAGGTNRKITATEIKDYMLGGGAGANFAAINVSGISTVTFADATTLKVGAGATVTGALDVDGGADIAGGLVANSAKVSDLTSGRVVLAGTDGELQDNGNLTFNGSTLAVTGAATVSSTLDVTGALDVDGGADVAGGLVANSAKVSDLTSGRVVLAGTAGELEDSGSLTFSGGTLSATEFSGSGASLTSIPNSALDNSSVSLGGVSVALGAADATPAFNLADATGLPISTGVAGLGANVATFLGTPSSANLAAAVTGETGSGALVFGTSPTISNANLLGNVHGGRMSVTNVNAAGIVTAASFRGSDIRQTDGGLIPLVGVSSASAHTGIVTSFKFIGSGLEEYKVEDGEATIRVSGVAATTFTTSQTITATQGQTSYTVSAGFTEGFCDVYHNGVRLITGTDYTQGSDGSTITLVSGATAGDELEFVAWKSLGDIVHIQSLKTASDLTVTGVATATGGFVGDLTGDVTGTVSDGSGLSAGTVPLTSLDIDGGTDIGADLADADLLIVDDGAGGTNRKTAMSRVKSYVLGGGSGATFAQINVTGIATNTYLKSTTAVVGAGLTVTGALDVNGGADISGGETVMSSATVSDLTSGRIVVAGGSGALGDDGNLTWDGSTMGVAGAINGSGGATITGGETVMSSATVSDLTSGRVVVAGASGALGDSGGLTYNGSTLAVTGAITASGNMTVSGDLVVEGSTTQINTTNTTIEDVLLELQKVDGGALSSDTNKDVGIVMNYYSGSAKKAAIYWDDSAARFVLASEAAENSGVMTPSTYGGLEVGSLYVNDCAGQSQVISCSGTTRSLENVTIDGGSF